MRILITGATGLIGSTLLRILSKDPGWVVLGTTRMVEQRSHLSKRLRANVVFEVNLLDQQVLIDLFETFKPDVVINAAGHTKHVSGWHDPKKVFPINSIFPHELAAFCTCYGSRLIQISTDCVFNGDRGMYTEDDSPDAADIYGLSKALGEVIAANHVTIRTSTIGHELNAGAGLLEWFLSQSGSCKGFKNAIFSGLPTVVLAQIIRDYIISNRELCGLYNLAGMPINKYDLLHLIADVYGKSIDILVDEDVVINRSLNGAKFYKVTGYKAPDWSELIRIMHASR